MVTGPFVLRRQTVSPTEFVDRWSTDYDYAQENLYDINIGKPLTRERVLQLFEWKNGGRFSRSKEQSVLRNYVERLHELEGLAASTSADVFLTRFGEGGAIWRVYWLHLWSPSRFPIYDQHVHRAMAWIQTGRPQEIPNTDKAKINAYLQRYLPFYDTFQGLDPRRVDKALWSCGKRMKSLVTAPVD